jgi:transcriptional regulator with XRE-family HTH domain
MMSDTVIDGLAAYEIGEKLRALRLSKKLGLVQLGQHTGLSPALLSKLERGRIFPTLATLLRIAMVYSVGLDYFFATEREAARVTIVRKNDRRRFPERPGPDPVAYHFESLDFPAVERRLSAFLAEFEQLGAEQVRPHTHPGVEFLYVLRGRLALSTRGEDHVLEEGDSAYLDATIPHAYRRIGEHSCSALVVTVPPNG